MVGVASAGVARKRYYPAAGGPESHEMRATIAEPDDADRDGLAYNASIISFAPPTVSSQLSPPKV